LHADDAWPDGPVPEDGLAWLDERRVADEAAWEALPPAGRQRVWYVTGLEPDRIAHVARELTAAYRAGEAVGTVLGRLESLGISVPGSQMPGEGQIPAAQARLVDHQNRLAAYSADRWIKAQRTLDTRPYGQYLTAGDDRVRPAHAALDGVVKPLGDPFWDKYTPPWEFGCRCTWVTVSAEELEAEGLAVTSDAEEAARYQAAVMLQGTEPTPDQIVEAATRLLPIMRRRESVDGLKAPAAPQWTFTRSDAYGLERDGWEPVTQAGRDALRLVRTLPTVAELL